MEKPVAAALADFEAQIIPPDAGPVQREECRRAFMAGVVSMFALLLQGADEDEEAGAMRLARIGLELEEYQASLMAQASAEEAAKAAPRKTNVKES